MRNKGLTLVEVLISTVLLALIMSGLANIFVAGKRHIMHSRYRMTSGELGSFDLEPLQAQVRQDQWASNCLGTGAGCAGTTDVDNMTYASNYSITPVTGTDLRRVVVTINWTEPTP
jgi:prepilin-type N-terminal cleavage/methylation domain-containing protein